MKLTVSKSELARAVSAVDKFSSGNFLGVDGYFMVESEGGSTTLCASRNGMTARISLECEVDEDGSFLLYANKLKQIISKAPDGDLHFEVDGSKVSVTAAKKRVHYTMKAMDSGRFPDFLPIEGKVVKGNAEWFLKGLSYARKASANDMTREMMCSVRLEFQKNGVDMVATDARRLHISSIKDFTFDGDRLDVLLPSLFVDSLCSAVKGGELEILIGEREFRVATSKDLFATPYVNAQYPNYKKVIPEYCPNEIAFNRDDLLGALERAAVINEHIILEKKGDSVSISASDGDIGDSSEIIGFKKGEKPSADFKMKMNLWFLKDAVNQFADDDVYFDYTDGNKAVMVSQRSKSETYGCGYAVLMPMRMD